MKRKKGISIVLIMTIIMLFYAQPIFAKEKDFIISEEIQSEINRLQKEDPSNKDYIDSVIENFYNDINTNSDDLNQLLVEAIDSLEKLQLSSDQSYSEAIKAQEELIRNNAQIKAAWQDLYISAMKDYTIGISLVKKKGCPNTANYMSHAIVPMDKVGTSWKPDSIYHKNDSWAKTLIFNEMLTGEIYSKFEQEILIPGKSYGSITGSFAFTSKNSTLDAFAALHKVNYSATFTKKSGGYSVAFKITDVYDFGWGAYDNFAVGFGNNYCYIMQSNGWIKPFNIIITANG